MIKFTLFGGPERTLRLHKDRVTFVYGPPRSGKSTLFNMLAGHPPARGCAVQAPDLDRHWVAQGSTHYFPTYHPVELLRWLPRILQGSYLDARVVDGELRFYDTRATSPQEFPDLGEDVASLVSLTQVLLKAADKSLVCIHHPEDVLSVRNQELLGELLYEIAAVHPNTHYLVFTHSPFLPGAHHDAMVNIENL